MVPPKADPLRVSQTVKRMMDADNAYEKGQPAGKRDDVELLSKDQELVFRKDDNKAGDGKEDQDATPSGETTQALDKAEIPALKDLKMNQPQEVKNSQPKEKTAEKEDAIMGLDPSNKDNQTKIPLKTID